METVLLTIAIFISTVCVQTVMSEMECNTETPNYGHCRSTLSVVHGTACYYANQLTSASISCDEQYSFDTAAALRCVGKSSWLPTAIAKCSSTVSPLYSTVHSKQPDLTDSVFTTLFRSTLLPSESTIFSTSKISVTPSLTTAILQSDTPRTDYSTRLQTELQTMSVTETMTSSSISVTPALTTAILQSDTIRTDYSTILQTELHTMSVTETVTSDSISASIQPITAMPNEVKDSDDIAVYITVPVVLCIIAIIGVIVFLLWRHRRRKSVLTVLKREKGPGSSITNKTYEVSTLNRHCSLISLRKSLDSGYTEIPLDTLQPEEASGNVYQTIDSLPEDQSGSNKTYGHLKQPVAKFIDMNYSHINTNKTVQQSMSDTTYAHTETDTESQASKDSLGDGESTYNRLNTIPTYTPGLNVPHNQVKENCYNESEYNHAKTGSPDPENQADNYSHLNGSLETQPILTRKENYKYHDNDKLTNAPTIEPYEFAKEPESPQYELAKEPGIPQYETAKDVDNLNRRNVNPNKKFADKAVKQEYEDLNQEFIGKRGYEEVVVGNSNNYFILEPEDRPSSNDESFHVAGDLSVEKGDTSDYTESVNHQYFTLEKADT